MHLTTVFPQNHVGTSEITSKCLKLSTENGIYINGLCTS